MKTVTRTALRYHGGKWRIAKWIVSHFPKHRVYIELFGGGASVLMQKPRSYAEVYNDAWDTVVNVFRVLRDPVQAKELERLIRLTPFSRTEFDYCMNPNPDTDDPVELARQTIFRSIAGFGSASINPQYATGFRANSNRSGTTPSHDWMNYPDHIASFTERLQGVVIENQDYARVIEQHDSPQSLFYVDPPYVHCTRNMKRKNAAYALELDDTGHRQLADQLHHVKGMVVLSGYHSALYDELYADWTSVQMDTHGDGAVDRTEVIWMNPKCAAAQNQLKLFHS